MGGQEEKSLVPAVTGYLKYIQVILPGSQMME